MTAVKDETDSAFPIGFHPMRSSILKATGLVLTALPCLALLAQDGADKIPSFTLPEIGASPSVSAFSDAEISHVRNWLAEVVPDYPAEQAPVAAEAFLDALRRRFPDQADRLMAADFPKAAHASALLRHAGAAAAGPAHAALRERIAALRIGLLAVPGAGEATELLGRIRDDSSFQHRRVLEGRLDDDELRTLVERTLRPAEAPRRTVPVAPRELKAADLVSEFARRNQNGAAVARLQAYTIEGRLTSGTGEKTEMLLFKMRPNRFRLVLRREGRTLSILAGDGDQYWLQIPGQPVRGITARDMGERRLLGEFIDPLFAGDGHTFERLPDGEEAGRKFHRLAVRRADGTGHVVRLDTGSFLQIGRENADGSIVHYGDHREFAGIMLAFREEIADGKGGINTLEVTRMTANPGLIADFFRPPSAGQPAYFEFEQAVARAAGVTAATNP